MREILPYKDRILAFLLIPLIGWTLFIPVQNLDFHFPNISITQSQMQLITMGFAVDRGDFISVLVSDQNLIWFDDITLVTILNGFSTDMIVNEGYPWFSMLVSLHIINALSSHQLSWIKKTLEKPWKEDHRIRTKK